MGKWTNAPTPAGLPGKGLAQHPMLYVGENYTKMFLVNDGKVIWTYQTGKGYEYDDVWMLSNGNILFTRMQYVAEITPDKKVVWRYDCDNSTGTNHTEVHTCQPIGLDKVMFVAERPAAPADGRQHQDRRGGGESRAALRPAVQSQEHSRAISPGALHRAGNLSRFLS